MTGRSGRSRSAALDGLVKGGRNTGRRPVGTGRSKKGMTGRSGRRPVGAPVGAGRRCLTGKTHSHYYSDRSDRCDKGFP